MRSLLLVFVLSLSALLSLNAQVVYEIKGTVKDNSGQPLAGATVFLTNSKQITACDNQGMFRLNVFSSGTYEVVVKMIGFATKAIPILIDKKSVEVDMSLQTETNLLDEVVVTAGKDKSWNERYKVFQTFFLGTTPNSRKCRILNPKILHFKFERRSGTLSARASDFIVIENRALGYRIKYLLTHFSFSDSTHIFSYSGYPSFQELNPNSAKEKLLWISNRRKAYYGSIANFMQSVYQNKVYDNGFAVYKGKKTESETVGLTGDIVQIDKHPILFDSLLHKNANGMESLTFKDCLYVVYTRAREPYELKNTEFLIDQPKSYKIPEGQVSLLNMVDNSIQIDAHGRFIRNGGIVFQGMMGWERVADLTPLELNEIPLEMKHAGAVYE